MMHGLLAPLAASALRACALAALVAAALALLRVRSPLARLAAWTTVLIAALALPLLTALLPPLAWRVALPTPLPRAFAPATMLPAAPRWRAAAAPLPSTVPLAAAPFPILVALPAPHPPAPQMPPPRAGWPLGAPLDWLAALYCLGALLLLARVVWGSRQVRRLERAARPIANADLLVRLTRQAAHCRLHPPRLRESAHLAVPLAVGVRRAILLPADWPGWNAAKRDAVLAHELSHVARRDALTQRLALLYRALYWFSPLAWWLPGQLAALAEAASDQAALASGAEPAAYARVLLDFFASTAWTGSAPRRARWQGLAMAESGAERRIAEILAARSARPDRLEAGRRWALAALAAPLVFLCAAVLPAARQPLAAALPIPKSPALAVSAAALAAPPPLPPPPAPTAAERCGAAFDPDGNPSPNAAALAASCATLDDDPYAWTRAYAGKPGSDLVRDAQFPALLRNLAPDAVYHMGTDMTLGEAADQMLRGSASPVALQQDRYLMFSAHPPSATHSLTFVWIDLQQRTALGAIVFHPSNGEPTPTLTLFSRQIAAHGATESALPSAFLRDLDAAIATHNLPGPMARYFVNAAGVRSVLIHPAAACPAGAIEAALCQAANQDTADADLAAALYLLGKQYGEGTQARAELDAAQSRWLDTRDSACGRGAAGTTCRLKMTRARAGDLDDLYLQAMNQ